MAPPSRRLLRVYVDETGDRGCGGKSSAFFAFAAVLVADEDESTLRASMSRLRNDFKTPAGKPLHWNEHVKVFARRQHVAKVLGSTPNISIFYIISRRPPSPEHAPMRTNHVAFYNFAAGMVLEHALLAARDWPGGARDALIRFGHVRGFDHSTTLDYFAKKSQHPASTSLPWHLQYGAVHFNDQTSWDGLQAADQYAGMLYAGLEPDPFGGYEAHHLLQIAHQIRRNPKSGDCWEWRFKLLGNKGTMNRYPWWPADGL